MDVLAFGSANVDHICYVKRLPKSGETIHGYKYESGFGGKGANQCVAAAKLGANTAIITKVGCDSWGKDFIQHLKNENINVDFVEHISKQPTGLAQINVAKNGDNQIVIIHGANDFLSPNDVKRANHLFETSKVLVCQLESPLESTIAAIQAFKGISILNAAPAIDVVPTELLSFATIFCANESEASHIVKKDIVDFEDVVFAIAKLVELGGNTIIITMGKNGAVYNEKNTQKIIHIKTKHVENVVDTTGAGDAFIGALAFFIAKYPDQKLQQQIGAACEIASISVQFPGTQCSFPSGKNLQIDAIIQKEFEWVDLTNISN